MKRKAYIILVLCLPIFLTSAQADYSLEEFEKECKEIPSTICYWIDDKTKDIERTYMDDKYPLLRIQIPPEGVPGMPFGAAATTEGHFTVITFRPVKDPDLHIKVQIINSWVDNPNNKVAGSVTVTDSKREDVEDRFERFEYPSYKVRKDAQPDTYRTIVRVSFYRDDELMYSDDVNSNVTLYKEEGGGGCVACHFTIGGTQIPIDKTSLSLNYISSNVAIIATTVMTITLICVIYRLKLNKRD